MIRQFLLNQKENVTCPVTFNTRHSTVTHDAEDVDGKILEFWSFELKITFQFYFVVALHFVVTEKETIMTVKSILKPSI